MNDTSARANIERFHLVLLSFLGKKLDKQSYALKGGCNLRFFFGSPRYSEDMDIDVIHVQVHALRDTIGAILKSGSFTQAIQVQGIAIEHVTEHKQSETTQRWKLGLSVRGSERAIPTKLEFSRRGFAGSAVLGGVDATLLLGYGLPPVLTPHYTAEVALLQKIQALATRSVTQARDIFDLHILQSRASMKSAMLLVDDATIDAAKQNALRLSFEDFKGQVLAYLRPDDQATYDSPQAWESIQLAVIEAMEAAR